ncbi:MAG TPA: DUF547 domain-containing protein [Vicinamibacterales bacterium]|nr:DUF547 domain-containing protein [Vicinamibacterales bacterium]
MIAFILALICAPGLQSPSFDHAYRGYHDVLRAHIGPSSVNYAALKADRRRLDEVVKSLSVPTAAEEASWDKARRMAFWINAYNVLTLRAIVDHYPIQSRWLTRLPRNSIRQIDGVWTTLSWPVAGRTVTLDDIEHRILRPVFKDPRIHFAVNCASVSCPPLAVTPYLAETLDAQLDTAARRFFASGEGVQLVNGSLRVSSLLKWYGGDFVEQFAPAIAGSRAPVDRAVLGALVRYAPAAVADVARSYTGTIRFLDYNWALNDREVR